MAIYCNLCAPSTAVFAVAPEFANPKVCYFVHLLEYVAFSFGVQIFLMLWVAPKPVHTLSNAFTVPKVSEVLL